MARVPSTRDLHREETASGRLAQLARASRLHREGRRFESYIVHMEFYTYILHNLKHDKFYIGQTNDSDKRTAEHNLGLSNYTSKYDGEWKLVYREIFNSRSEAVKRERFLKRQRNKDFYRKLCGIQKTSEFSVG